MLSLFGLSSRLANRLRSTKVSSFIFGSRTKKPLLTQVARFANQANEPKIIVDDLGNLSKDEIKASILETESKLDELQKLLRRMEYLSSLPLCPARNKKYELRVPRGETNILYDSETWDEKFPPFIDRYRSLLSLLTSAYESHYGIKPVVTMCSTAPGFGKTRTLIEWGVQVFQRPCVVKAFFAGEEIPDPEVDEDIGIQITTAWNSGDDKLRKKALFLVRLHRTLRESTVISMTSKKIMEPFVFTDNRASNDEVQAACKHIIAFALDTRFPGVPKPDLAKVTVETMIKDYFALVEKSVPRYAINDPVVTDKSLLAELANTPRTLMINIDEFQELLPIKGTRDPELKNLAYEIARMFVTTKQNIVVNMVGLQAGPIGEISDEESTAFMMRPSIPLDPLLLRSYLDAVMKAICGRGLYKKGFQNTLPKELSNQLHLIWISACGIPRTIERFAEKLAKDHQDMLRNIAHNSSETLSNEEEVKIYVSMVLRKSFDRFQQFVGLDDKQFNLLLLNAVFCFNRKPSDTIGKTTCELLESKSFLIPFHFIDQGFKGEVERRYTIPFFMYYSELYKEIPALASDLSNIQNQHSIGYQPCEIRLDYAIKALGRAVAQSTSGLESFSGANKPVYIGQILEKAAAISIWLRYLRATEMERNKLCPLSEVLETLNLDGYIQLNGVINLDDQIGFKEDQSKTPNFKVGIEFLFKNKLIAINKANSSFADVLVPLYNAQGQPTNLLCIQCRNAEHGSSSIKPFYLYKEASRILSESTNFIYIVLSPNLIDTPMSQRAKRNVKQWVDWETSKRFIASNGNYWLSDWFLTLK